MPKLVDYSSSSSSSEDDDDKSPALPSKQDDNKHSLPALPSCFHNLYATAARSSTNDDPSLHGGRKRQVPHIEGNWPSHVYTEWYPDSTISALLSSLIDNFARRTKLQLTTLLYSDLGAALPLHISLSRSLPVPTESRDSLLAKFKQCIQSCRIQPFHVIAHGLTWAANYDETRWFLALSLDRPEGDELNKLLKACNRVAQEAGYPRLYAHDASKESEDSRDFTGFFHFSLAWSLAPKEALTAGHDVLNEMWKNALSSTSSRIKVLVDRVLVKIGNTVHSVELSTKLESSVHAAGF